MVRTYLVERARVARRDELLDVRRHALPPQAARVERRKSPLAPMVEHAVVRGSHEVGFELFGNDVVHGHSPGGVLLKAV